MLCGSRKIFMAKTGSKTALLTVKVVDSWVRTSSCVCAHVDFTHSPSFSLSLVLSLLMSKVVLHDKWDQ